MRHIVRQYFFVDFKVIVIALQKKNQFSIQHRVGFIELAWTWTQIHWISQIVLPKKSNRNQIGNRHEGSLTHAFLTMEMLTEQRTKLQQWMRWILTPICWEKRFLLRYMIIDSWLHIIPGKIDPFDRFVIWPGSFKWLTMSMSIGCHFKESNFMSALRTAG